MQPVRNLYEACMELLRREARQISDQRISGSGPDRVLRLGLGDRPLALSERDCDRRASDDFKTSRRSASDAITINTRRPSIALYKSSSTQINPCALSSSALALRAFRASSSPSQSRSKNVSSIGFIKSIRVSRSKFC